MSVHSLVICALHDKVERLGEAKEEDDVDDGEGEHVSGDHGEDHRNKWTRQLYGSFRDIIKLEIIQNSILLYPAKNMR